jgi:hypothetical protein
MDLDTGSVDQRHIFDEQAENTFSFPGFHTRIIPDSREVGSQREQLFPRFRVNPCLR